MEVALPGGVVSNTGNHVRKNDRSGRGCIVHPLFCVGGKMKNKKKIYRGEIYFADMNPVMGSEQGGRRPVLIIQNDTGNQYAPTTIVAPITSQKKKHIYPTHVNIGNVEGLEESSIVMLEQLRTIAKERLEFRIGKLNARMMRSINRALFISLGLNKTVYQKEYRD